LIPGLQEYSIFKLMPRVYKLHLKIENKLP